MADARADAANDARGQPVDADSDEKDRDVH